MSNDGDGDIETADTERPVTRGVLVVELWQDPRVPRWFSSLTEATADPAPSAMAIVHANGLVLATGNDNSDRWLITAAGQLRLQDEAATSKAAQ